MRDESVVYFSIVKDWAVDNVSSKRFAGYKYNLRELQSLQYTIKFTNDLWKVIAMNVETIPFPEKSSHNSMVHSCVIVLLKSISSMGEPAAVEWCWWKISLVAKHVDIAVYTVYTHMHCEY